jgi:hypothetical protein
VTRKIGSIVEMGITEDIEYHDLPDGWDDWTTEQQAAFCVDVAVTHQNNVAPCGATVIDEADE